MRLKIKRRCRVDRFRIAIDVRTSTKLHFGHRACSKATAPSHNFSRTSKFFLIVFGVADSEKLSRCRGLAECYRLPQLEVRQRDACFIRCSDAGSFFLHSEKAEKRLDLKCFAHCLHTLGSSILTLSACYSRQLDLLQFKVWRKLFQQLSYIFSFIYL